MKLVYRILLHMSWALSLLLAAWAVLFYFTTVSYTHLTLPTIRLV